MIKLKPSVLKVASTSHSGNSENNSDNNNSNGERVCGDSLNNGDKVHSENIFKFAPLAKAQIGNVRNGTENKASSENQSNQLTVCSSSSTSSGTSDSTSKGFLFGQNLEERVLLPSQESSSDNNVDQQGICEPKSEPSCSSASDSNSISQNLPEKRKYEAITGEEDESNILQIYCKLYLWDSSNSVWKERGKGLLRLNDKINNDQVSSRLVMRTSGCLKVVLNASIVPGMKFATSGENCLRFTHIDGVYLVKAKAKEIDHLHSAIESRLRELAKKIRSSNDDVKNVSKPKESERETSKELEKSSESDDSPSISINKETPMLDNTKSQDFNKE